MNKIDSCAFTGHRPKSFPFAYNEECNEFYHLTEQIRNTIIQACNAGCRTFYCGMAEGADLLCGEMVLNLKKQYDPELKLICVVPYIDQPKSMTKAYQARYRKIMESADQRYLVSKEYKKQCFYKRNRFMVDSADALIAVFKKGEEYSGTAQTIRYARKKKKCIFLIEI